MGEMFKQGPLAKKWPKHVLAVIAVARPQDMVLRSDHIADRIDLQESQITDDPEGVDRPRRRVHQTVCRQPEPPQIAVADGNAVCGDADQTTGRAAGWFAGGFRSGHHPPMAHSKVSRNDGTSQAVGRVNRRGS